MQALPVVEHFDVFKNAGPGLCARVIALKIDQLGLQGMEKALGHGIVVTVACAAHTLLNIEAGELAAKNITGILAALIAVENQPITLVQTCAGMLKCRDDCLLRCQVFAHRPTDNFTVENILHHGQIQPAFAGADVGDVEVKPDSGDRC